MGRGDRRGLAGAPARLMQGVWRVFATYVAAVAGIFAASGMAIVTLKSMFPDTPDQALLQSLPALIAGSLASSFALIFTLLAILQPATPAALRLLPGWESRRALVHMALAFAMGLYLGFVVERTGSVLPAIVCHVVNNVVYTLQTAFGGTLQDRRTNAVVAAACALLFVLCLAWLRRASPPGATTAV